MLRYLVSAVALTLGLSQFVFAEPIPGAQEIIDDLELREAEQPISEHPNWAPKKILMVLARNVPGVDIRGTVEQLTPGIEVEFISPPGFQIEPETLAGADALVGWCMPQILYDADDSLLWVHNYGVGMDRCNTASKDLFEGRVFTNNKGLSGPGIAEHTIAMMFTVMRNFPAAMDAQRQNKWNRGLTSNMTFGELSEKTMLVAGLGGIGKQVAKRANALGMRVIATRNSSREGPDYVDYVGLADELNTLAAQADVVVNTLPLTDKTRGVFDKTFFDQMPDNSIFLSVGRGGSTVQDDLIAALESGKLYGAGLDVTDPEPLPADSPLWQMENVLITPHISGGGAANIYRSAIIALENLRRYVEGEPLLNIVDMDAGY